MEELIYLLVGLILWPFFARIIGNFFVAASEDQKLTGTELLMAGCLGFATALVWPVTIVVAVVAALIGVQFKDKLR